MLAKMVATMDVLSSGRAILGVGAGWSQTEFEGYSTWDDSKTRVDKTQEGVELILQLWHQSQVEFKGKYYHVKGAILDLVKNESGSAPLSDKEIVEILGQRGIPIARRTVAKYRTELNILPSNMRRRY